MSRTLSKAVVFAIAVVFAAAPLVFAQATTPGTSPGATAPGTQEQHRSTSSTTTQSSQMSTTGQDILNATVADVNHQHQTVKLKMQGGETVEFKVPEASLTNLNKGDSVQVSIRKAEAHPGMAPSQPESTRPESTTPSSPGTRSR